MTHDPMKSAAADAAATAAAFGARSNYAKGHEDGAATLAHVRTEGAKALEEATTALVAAESRIAVEASRAARLEREAVASLTAAGIALPVDEPTAQGEIPMAVAKLARQRDAEASRADVAEQRVCELRAIVGRMEAKAEAGWMRDDHACVECVGTESPRWSERWLCARHSVGPTLDSTADIAGRWVSATKYGRMVHTLLAERDAAIKAQMKAEAALADGIGAEAARVLARAERARDEVLSKLTACEMAHVVEIGKVAAAERARDEAVAAKSDWMASWRDAEALRDRAEKARDEVGIQYAAAQERLRLVMVCVKAGDDVVTAAMLACESQGILDVLKHNLNALERRCSDYFDAKDALDTVPGDALAKVPEKCPHCGGETAVFDPLPHGGLASSGRLEALIEASGIDTDNVKGVE